jgi:phospholipid/cholesterol/gamma-HCH transport system ATP-binding protein
MIRVSGVSVRFGDRTVIDDVSLNVEKGETVAIMGASGGGKTTLLRVMSGLLVPTSGTVELFEIDINNCSHQELETIRLRTGILFQGAALFDYLNVFDNVSFGVIRHTNLSKKQVEGLVSERLKRVGLQGTEKLMPSELSGGMKKRVGLARALATDPSILFYDEPTSGLDPITAYSIDSLIVDLAKSTASASVVISHDLHSVMRVCSRVVFLWEGKVIADGEPQAFLKSTDPRIRELIDKSEATEFSTA